MELMRPIQLLHLDDEGRMELREEALRDLLDLETLKGRQLAVLSVVGAFRTGNSFLLNLLLRYLRHKGSNDWLEKDGALSMNNSEIYEFPFKHGCERDTRGILVWPEVFTVQDDLAILLMDTQGMFDLEESLNIQIYTLSTLMSSVQIFNVNKQLQMDILHNVQFLSEFGKMFQDNDSNQTPFNRLMFLIRDWMCCKDFEYGMDGGNKMVESKWKNLGKEKKNVWDSIESCYTSVDCFLMPFPGIKVATGNEFAGLISEISEDFSDQMKILAEELLSPETVVVKTVCGQPMKVELFASHVRKMFNSLQSSSFPEPKTTYELMMESTSNLIISEAIELYLDCMVQESLSSHEELCRNHEEAMLVVQKHLNTKLNFGGRAAAKYCLEQITESALHSNKAKEVYCTSMLSNSESEEECDDLREMHNKALLVALQGFDNHPSAKNYEVTLKIFRGHLKQAIYTVHEVNRRAMQSGKKFYACIMDEKCANAVDNLYAVHQEALARAMQEFDSLKSHNMFDASHVYRKNLRQQLNNSLSLYNDGNNEKLEVLFKNMSPEEQWKHQCKKQQLEAHSMLGDRYYDVISSSDENNILEMKVGFALYGNPINNSEYSKDQTKLINEIAKKIKKKAKTFKIEEIYISFIYILCADLKYKPKHFKKDVILRIGGEHLTDIPIFIDESKKTYKSWADFLENNKYEKTWICYPKGGFYHIRDDGSVDLEFTETFASKALNTVKNIASVTSMIGGLGVAGAAAPIVAPIAGAAMVAKGVSSAYSGARSISTLIQQFSHDESTDSTDVESECVWMDTTVTPLVFVSSLEKLLTASNKVSRWNNLLTNGFKMSNALDLGACLSTQGLSFTLQLWKFLIESENDELSLENIFLLRCHLLLYFHVFISKDKAQEIFQKFAEDIKDFLDKQIQKITSNIIPTSLDGNNSEKSITLLSLTTCDTAENLMSVFIKNSLPL